MPPRTSGLRFAKGVRRGCRTRPGDDRPVRARRAALRRPADRDHPGPVRWSAAGPASYRVTASEAIGALVDLPNHDDDGVENPAVVGRQLTGIEVAGTADQPVIYAVTTDPRIGGGPKGLDLPLDTNSGVLSRLTRDGTGWRRTDLVRGLPRSEENHAGNGLVLDRAHVAAVPGPGGQHQQRRARRSSSPSPPSTPSPGRSCRSTWPPSARRTYDLPTLDDPARPGTADAGDPFGGAERRQPGAARPRTGRSRCTPPGSATPTTSCSPPPGGSTRSTTEPTPNWGDAPRPAGGRCTNEPRPGGKRQDDTLHYIADGRVLRRAPQPHPGQSGQRLRRPVARRRQPVPRSASSGPERSPAALTTFPASTNGLVEYRSQALRRGAGRRPAGGQLRQPHLPA